MKGGGAQLSYNIQRTIVYLQLHGPAKLFLICLQAGWGVDSLSIIPRLVYPPPHFRLWWKHSLPWTFGRRPLALFFFLLLFTLSPASTQRILVHRVLLCLTPLSTCTLQTSRRSLGWSVRSIMLATVPYFWHVYKK